MLPAVAVIVPLIVTSPALVKWKLLELISTLPPLPLTNALCPPKKNDGVKISTALPLNVVVPLLNISMFPPLPLIKLLSPPRKKLGVSISTLLPLSVVVPDENISMLPFAPLTKELPACPKKNWSVTTSNVLGFVLNFKYLSCEVWASTISNPTPS